jgi:hypothetical protein
MNGVIGFPPFIQKEVLILESKDTDYEAECVVDYSHKIGAVDWTAMLLSYWDHTVSM